MADTQSYSAFYARNADMVYAVALSYLKQKEDAEDAAADIFAQVFEKEMTFESTEHERAFLITAVKNYCRNRLRHWTRSQNRDDELPEQAVSDEAAVQLHTAMQYIAEMPERYRLPLVLSAIQGYSTAETAKILKTNESTIRTRISRAREMLMKKMGGEQK